MKTVCLSQAPVYFTYINDVESVIVLLMQCINSNKKYQKIHVCSFICVMKCLGLCSYCVHVHSELPELPNVTSELVGQCTLWLVWKSVYQT